MSRRILHAAVLGLNLAIGSVSSAVSGTDQRGTNSRSVSTPQAIANFSMGPNETLRSVTESGQVSTNSSVFVNVPGATVVDSFSGSARKAYHVTFSATCAINGSGQEEDVEVQVLIDGIVMQPGATTMCEDFGTNPSAIPEGAAALQWAIKSRTPGTHTIQVQWRIVGGGMGLLRNFNLTVRRHANRP